ncbi:hypothetical protein TrVE_jg2182 [Triparma verrucosa]|uniref:DIX domain-containing protein n=1 Tax=Triparma verrucosa TaxID=1606542 RepID=A0A9W7FLQ4_9STRA|nr:hypothetical protein TrVE_jg2182 [Triparma verrucosa]
MTAIRYFIPSDGDDETHPNIFQHPSSGPFTLNDLQRHFPLPGDFHWRLKTNLGKGHVWLDVVSTDSTIPTFKSPQQGEVIVAKLTRLESTGSNDSHPHSQPRTTAPAPQQRSVSNPNPAPPTSRSPPRPSLDPTPSPTVASLPPQIPEETLLFDVTPSSPPPSDFLNAPTSDTDELLTIGLSVPPRTNRGVSAPVAVNTAVHDPFGSHDNSSVLTATKEADIKVKQDGLRKNNGGMGRGVNPNVQQGNFGAFDAFNMQGAVGRGRGGHRNSTWN